MQVELLDLKEKLTKQLTVHEGRLAKAYKDTKGLWTWGVGRNLDDVGLSKDEIVCLLTRGKDAAIDLCLSNDIDRAFQGLELHVPVWRDHGWERAGVLANMCFNLGISKLLTFKRTLRAFELGDYDGTARHMSESDWHKQVGRRAVTLEHIMKTGEWIERYYYEKANT